MHIHEWTAGYVADLDYTYGYYPELNPLRLRLALLLAGYAVGRIRTACELGFGQGVSINVHAAASSVEWHGTDFNPSQAAFAREVADASGSGAQLSDQAFSEFCNRTDLPEFDLIGLHGIWSWISDANRSVIVEFIRQKLRPGGILYISYNTQPGWAPFLPLRNLLTEHADVMGSAGSGISERIDGALNFADRLFATDPAFVRANPQITERLKALGGQGRNYLAHEYFNRDWRPMHFSEVARLLSPAKVSYCGTAQLWESIDLLNLTAEQRELLADIRDPVFSQSIRDFMVNQQFRRDIWMKGPRSLSAIAKDEELRRLPIMLASRSQEVSPKIKWRLGEASLSEAVYGPLLECLSGYEVKTIGEVAKDLEAKGVGFSSLVETMTVLASSHHITAVQSEVGMENVRAQCRRLNALFCDRARGDGEIAVLASPLTGGGVTVTRVEQLFVSALAAGQQKPEDWARYAWNIVSVHGQKIIKDGVVLETLEANVAELCGQAKEFSMKKLPSLRALGVV